VDLLVRIQVKEREEEKTNQEKKRPALYIVSITKAAGASLIKFFIGISGISGWGNHTRRQGAAWSDKNQHEGANYNRIKSRFYLMRFWKKKKESNKSLQP
jgi:hypothetical protein